MNSNDMLKQSSRNSGIELLRIVAALMVIVLHYIGFGTDLLKNYNEFNKLNIFSAFFFESLCIGAVDIFMLISGYCGIKQKSIFKIKKIIEIMLLASFWSLICYFVSVLTKYDTFSIQKLLNYAFPYFSSKLWYVSTYLKLMFIAPVLNIVLKSLSKRQYIITLSAAILLFAVIPFFFARRTGYDVVQYIILYAVGGYFSLYGLPKINPIISLVCYGFFSGITFLIRSYIGIDHSIGRNVFDYTSVFTIAASVCLLLTFAKFDFKSQKVNFLAKGTLSIYILNVFADSELGKLYYYLIKSNQFQTSKYFLIHLFVCTVGFFIAGTLLDILRRKIFDKTVNKGLNKCKIINRVIEYNFDKQYFS